MSQKERVSVGKDVTGEQEQRFSITIETATSISSSRTTWTSIHPGFGNQSEPWPLQLERYRRKLRTTRFARGEAAAL